LIEQSVGTPKSPSIAARSLAGPTSGRSYRRADLEEASNQLCLVSEDTQQGLERRVVNNEAWQSDVNLEHMDCRVTQISCIAARSLAETPEACRPQEGLKSKAPKHPEALGRAIRRAPHRETFIPDVKSWVSRAGWLGYKSTPTSEGHASLAPN
jgi:hypothetical protein